MARLIFFPWQPSTWPDPPDVYMKEFGMLLNKILQDSLLTEIENVINDAPTLVHRGHVVALSMLCAIDAVSSYALRNRSDKVGPRYREYIKRFFPSEYSSYANQIYRLYRNSITHNWNLFSAAMTPLNETIKEKNGIIVIGLPHFFLGLKTSVNNFIGKLETETTLQNSALRRYKELRISAVSSEVPGE